MPRYYAKNKDQPSSYSSSSTTTTKLFGRERPLHAVLGGGKVAEILLWRNKNLSAAVLIGFTVLWFLFEIVEYHFLTLLCHIFITTMLILFIWSNAAPLFNRDPPTLPKIILSESAFQEVAKSIHKKLNRLVLILFNIACGKELSLFIPVIVSLWILSVIGTNISTLNLLYFGFLCMITLPPLYERHENEMEYLASKSNQDIKKLYKKFDSNVLNKIPRGPVKDKNKFK
ncbi:reticulon-like protein B9 [Macadamia integrifolia]|uniref:reticulon-like protein B9 n=1 Tax=Macadamia integrifolia TaxID=60698 RepID=UPI001C4E6F26|nr:reticulon-like protein B9 [Macadamia integrifolia]